MIRSKDAVVAGLLLAVAVALVGCATGGNGADGVGGDGAERAAMRTPRAPDAMEDVAARLMRYQAQYDGLPASLQLLVTSGVISQSQYNAMPAFLYQRGGLGTLPSGQIVLLVDARIREAGHVWCVVEDPEQGEGTTVVEVKLVPMSELEAIARRRDGDSGDGGGGRSRTRPMAG